MAANSYLPLLTSLLLLAPAARATAALDAPLWQTEMSGSVIQAPDGNPLGASVGTAANFKAYF